MNQTSFGSPRPLSKMLLLLRISFVALALLIAATGCDDNSQSTTNGDGEQGGRVVQSFAGKQLTIAAPKKGMETERWRPLLDEWSEQSGGTYQIVTYDADDNSQPLSERSWNSAQPDLFFFPVERRADLVASNQLAPLNDKQQAMLDWFDILPGLRETIASPNGKPTIIPISAPVLVCYYRHDLLKAANLTPPATWEEYQHLVEHLDEWAPGLSAVEPWSPETRPTMFFARSLAYAKHSGHYSLFLDVASGEPLIDTRGFARALQDVARVLPNLTDDSLQLTPERCRDALVAGKAAIGIGLEIPGKQGVELSDTQTKSADERLLHCIPLPGSDTVFNHTAEEWTKPSNGVNRPALSAFSGLAAGVSTASSDEARTEACRVLRLLAIDNLATSFAVESTSLCRLSQSLQSDVWSQLDLAPEEANSYAEAVSASLRSAHVVAELPSVGRQQLLDVVEKELSAWLAGSRTVSDTEETLKNIEQQWKAIIETIGVDLVRDSYRQSVGLPGK